VYKRSSCRIESDQKRQAGALAVQAGDHRDLARAPVRVVDAR
jgi:hypothetical protein